MRNSSRQCKEWRTCRNKLKMVGMRKLMREGKGKVVLEGKVVIKKLALLQGSCQSLHVQAAIRQIRVFVTKRVLLRIRTFVAKRVSLQIRAFLGLFGADF